MELTILQDCWLSLLQKLLRLAEKNNAARVSKTVKTDTCTSTFDMDILNGCVWKNLLSNNASLE